MQLDTAYVPYQDAPSISTLEEKMRKVYKERLLKLAKLLRKNAKNKKGVKFDITSWGHSTSSAVPLSCGTTACAMGLAAISGVFKREGLDYDVRLSLDSDSRDASIEVFHKDRYGNLSFGFEAACELFDISYHDATQLFSNVGYKGTTRGAKGELKVANKISQYVRDH